MISRRRLKNFLSGEHSIEEHLQFLYEAVIELNDRLEELESKLDEKNGGREIRIPPIKLKR